MGAWHWLTEPTHIPLFVAIIGIVSGIIGGLIAGLFKYSGDIRALKAADKIAEAAEVRWRKEQEFARTQYLLDARRDAYVRFLKAANGHLSLMFRHVHARFDNPNVEDVSALFEDLLAIDAMVSEVTLYGQTVGERARDLVNSLPAIDLLTPSNFNESMRPWQTKFQRLRGMMQQALGIEDLSTKPQNKPQRNEAPVSGKKIDTGETSTNPT